MYIPIPLLELSSYLYILAIWLVTITIQVTMVSGDVYKSIVVTVTTYPQY